MKFKINGKFDEPVGKKHGRVHKIDAESESAVAASMRVNDFVQLFLAKGGKSLFVAIKGDDVAI